MDSSNVVTKLLNSFGVFHEENLLSITDNFGRMPRGAGIVYIPQSSASGLQGQSQAYGSGLQSRSQSSSSVLQGQSQAYGSGLQSRPQSSASGLQSRPKSFASILKDQSQIHNSESQGLSRRRLKDEICIMYKKQDDIKREFFTLKDDLSIESEHGRCYSSIDAFFELNYLTKLTLKCGTAEGKVVLLIGDCTKESLTSVCIGGRIKDSDNKTLAYFAIKPSNMKGTITPNLIKEMISNLKFVSFNGNWIVSDSQYHAATYSDGRKFQKFLRDMKEIVDGELVTYMSFMMCGVDGIYLYEDEEPIPQISYYELWTDVNQVEKQFSIPNTSSDKKSTMKPEMKKETTSTLPNINSDKKSTMKSEMNNETTSTLPNAWQGRNSHPFVVRNTLQDFLPEAKKPTISVAQTVSGKKPTIPVTGTVLSKTQLKRQLRKERQKSTHVTTTTSIAPKVESIEVAQKVDLKIEDVISKKNSDVTTEISTSDNSDNTMQINYTTENGDNISCIAKKTNNPDIILLTNIGVVIDKKHYMIMGSASDVDSNGELVNYQANITFEQAEQIPQDHDFASYVVFTSEELKNHPVITSCVPSLTNSHIVSTPTTPISDVVNVAQSTSKNELTKSLSATAKPFVPSS